MITKPWGAQFTFNYYPHVNGEPVDPPDQTPSIYVFESVPSTDAIDNGTGAVGVEITTWTETKKFLRTFTIPAVDDPGGSTKSKTYYVGIKYVLHGSGTSTYDVKPFTLTRPDGFSASPVPTSDDLKERDSTLEKYFPNYGDIEDQINASVINVKAWFRARGLKWAQIENPEDLKEVIIYEALADLFSDRIKGEGDTFSLKTKMYRDMSTTLREQLKIEYDSNNDNAVDEGEKEQPSSTIFFSR